MERKWCWRCEERVPTLTDDEYGELKPLLMLLQAASEIDPQDPIHDRIKRDLADFFTRLTGSPDVPLNDARNHRLSLIGPDCPECGYPLRTSRASLCAACSWRPGAEPRPDGLSRPEAALATFIVGKATESFKHFGTVSPYFCGWVPQGLSYSRAGFLDVLYQGHDLKDLVLEAQGRAAAVLRDARWCALVDRSDGTAPLLVLVQDRMRSTSTRLVQEFTKTPKGWRPAAPWRVEGVGPPICLVPWEPPA